MEDVNRILVVSKSTKYCRKAVHYAVSLARKYGAEIVILHVIHNPFGLEGWNLPLASLPQVEKEYDDIFKDAKADLDRIIAEEKATGLPIKELIVEGNPTKKIFEVVTEENIDLLVMLAHEEWRIEHLILSRGLDEIVRRMPCSVFLVKK